MLTLNEMEKHIDWLDKKEDNESFAEFNRITNTRLLIRAVRQLGDIAKREDWPSYWTGSEWRSIDPDVLALLEEGRSAE